MKKTRVFISESRELFPFSFVLKQKSNRVENMKGENMKTDKCLRKHVEHKGSTHFSAYARLPRRGSSKEKKKKKMICVTALP